MEQSCLFEGNENVSPIYIEDNLMIGCSYSFLLDVTKANATYLKGKEKDANYSYEDALKEELERYIQMIVENTREEFELCKAKLAEELAKRYID